MWCGYKLSDSPNFRKKTSKIFKNMRFFTIFLLVAMALAQGSESSTAAVVQTTVAETIPAETTMAEDIGTGTVVSW